MVSPWSAPKDATSYCYEKLIADPLCCKECERRALCLEPPQGWHVGTLWQSNLGTRLGRDSFMDATWDCRCQIGGWLLQCWCVCVSSVHKLEQQLLQCQIFPPEDVWKWVDKVVMRQLSVFWVPGWYLWWVSVGPLWSHLAPVESQWLHGALVYRIGFPPLLMVISSKIVFAYPSL
jgi:hypothetical protein